MEELNKGYEFTKAQIAELESLRVENAKLKADVAAEVVQQIAEGEIWKELETLRARLAELEKQKPVAWMCWLDGDSEQLVSDGALTTYEPEAYPNRKPLYAAPVVSPDVERLKVELEELKASRGLRYVQQLQAENQSLKTELEAARKDAERYRWLRKADQNTVLRYSHYAFEALDKVIDAAIEQASSCNESHEKGGA